LRAMCNSSLAVWKNTLSICLFVFFFKKNKKIKLCYVVD